jgi:hypothetical protein
MPLYIFAMALGVGLASGVANLYVYLQLRRLGIPIRYALGGMPNYLLRLCAELPPSPTRNRLIRIAWWATLGFLFAFFVGAATGVLLAGGSHG